MASPLSKFVRPETTTGPTGRGAVTGPGLTEVAGAAARAGVVVEGVAALAGAGAAAMAVAVTASRSGGTGGRRRARWASVGSLIVGAEVGFGGKLMRTVSFFGWDL